jgi:hypothetical protein
LYIHKSIKFGTIFLIDMSGGWEGIKDVKVVDLGLQA